MKSWSVNVWTYWKCTSCGSVIRGDCRECPNCGLPIPSGVKYMMPDNPEVVSALANNTVFTSASAATRTTERHVDEKGIVSEVVSDELVSDKPNWNCVYCGYQNRFEDTECQGCGAGKEDVETDYFGDKPVMNSKNREDYEHRTGIEYEPDLPQKELPEPQLTPEPQRLSERILNALRGNARGIASVTALLGILVFLIWLFFPVTRTATVQDFEWERSIVVEEYTLCHENDWNVPSGGTITSQKEEIHHYDKVLDHYETKTKKVSERVLDHYDTVYKDLGNGQAKAEKKPVYKTVYHTETYQDPVYRKEPVYKTKYYYDIGRWKKVGSLDTSGSDQNPYWHETDIPTSVSNPSYGDRRQSGRNENYYIILTDSKGGSQKKQYDFYEWSNMQEGDTIAYKSFRFSYTPL